MWSPPSYLRLDAAQMARVSRCLLSSSHGTCVRCSRRIQQRESSRPRTGGRSSGSVPIRTLLPARNHRLASCSPYGMHITRGHLEDSLTKRAMIPSQDEPHSSLRPGPGLRHKTSEVNNLGELYGPMAHGLRITKSQLHLCSSIVMLGETKAN